MRRSAYDLPMTKRLLETKRYSTANKKLAAGWVLIGATPQPKGFVYLLALPGKRVEPSWSDPLVETFLNDDGLDLLS